MITFDGATTAEYSAEARLSLNRYVVRGAVGLRQKLEQFRGAESQFEYSMSYAITKNEST